MSLAGLSKKEAKGVAQVTSPEDFIGADQSALRQLDHSARCSICCDLFQSPVLLAGCSHTFCSSCIRVHLDANPGKPNCPACGAVTSETALKPNKALEEVTQKWAAARALVLDLATKVHQQTGSSKQRKRGVSENQEVGSAAKRRKGDRNSTSSNKSRALSPNDSDLEILDSPKADDPNIDVECPICQRTMKNAAVAKHITKCNGDASQVDGGSGKSEWAGMMRGGSSSTNSMNSGQTGPKKMNRLTGQPSLNEVREKLKAHKLYDPSSAKDRALSKEFLISRYTRYTIAYNANQDASEAYRRPYSALRKQVYEAEKESTSSNLVSHSTGTGASATAAPGSNLSQHAKNYEDQFAMLIRQARARGQTKSQGPVKSLDGGEAAATSETQDEKKDSRSPIRGPIEIQDSEDDGSDAS